MGDVGPSSVLQVTMAQTSLPTPPPAPVTLPPRAFDWLEYNEYKDKVQGIPKDIPQITAYHYVSMLVPIILLLVLLVHQREASARDAQDEYAKTKTVKHLLAIGGIFAGLVIAVHMRIIPVRVVRVIFPRWKVPPPMSKAMKIAIFFCFVSFIVYPTVKFFRRQRRPPRDPQVHQYMPF